MGSETAGASALAAVGVSAEDEAVYRVLLRKPGASAEDVARACGLTPQRVLAGMRALAEMGLLTPLDRDASTFAVPPPDIAIEALIVKRQQQLNRVRMTAFELREDVRRALGRGPADLIELITEQEPIRHRFLQLYESVEREVLAFDRPPYLALRESSDRQLSLLGRGVRFRVVYERAAIEYPSQLELIARAAAAGEQGRVTPSLPMKMFVFDRTTAFTPLFADAPHEGVAVIYPSALLDSLVALFEAFWERASPLSPRADESEGAGGAPRQSKDILMLLAAGLKDEAIARELGVDVRTVRRRIRGLMDGLAVTTRFQAGLQAAKNGWL